MDTATAEALRRERFACHVTDELNALRADTAAWADYLADADATDTSDGAPAHHRPALIIGPPDTFGADFPFVIACPLTSTRRWLSLHVEVEATDTTGLDTTSYVQCELIRSINRRRLVHQLGAIDSTTSDRVTTVTKTLLAH